MDENVQMKNVVKHLVNGSLEDNLCLICLTSLAEAGFKSIFTIISKESQHCVADALEAVCQIKLEGAENFNVCINCFQSTITAYKLHLQAKRNYEIISYYTQELINATENVQITDNDKETLLCIPIPLFEINQENFILNDKSLICKEKKHILPPIAKETDLQNDIILVVDKEKASYYELDDVKNNENSSSEDEDMLMIVNEKKERKKRDPMTYMSCSYCPIKYRFVSKLKIHTKDVHGVDIYYCKICKLISENKQDYEEHMKGHAGEHQCTICNVVYKKLDTLLTHMKTHDDSIILQSSETSNICEVCGAILPDYSALQVHMTDKHIKKFTCYYCGRMYKGEVSFDAHVKKHERIMDNMSGKSHKSKSELQTERDKTRRSVCQTCGKDFVDERSLLWHQRLHNDDRPFICDTCGRAFVSQARRNQHALCAHTHPQRQCPLCPALFHLRSMVNSHVKKVHLKSNKRRSRSIAPRSNVYWKTEPVPIQDLSVDVQAHLLDIRADQSASSAMHEYMDGSQIL